MRTRIDTPEAFFAVSDRYRAARASAHRRAMAELHRAGLLDWSHGHNAWIDRKDRPWPGVDYDALRRAMTIRRRFDDRAAVVVRRLDELWSRVCRRAFSYRGV